MSQNLPSLNKNSLDGHYGGKCLVLYHMALLRPQADQVHGLATVHNLTYTAKRSPTDSDSLPPPSSPFFHTHKQIYLQTLFVESPSPKVGGPGERLRKAE